MNPSRLFILRPVATTLLMAAILLGMIPYALVRRNRKGAGGHRADKPPAP